MDNNRVREHMNVGNGLHAGKVGSYCVEKDSDGKVKLGNACLLFIEIAKDMGLQPYDMIQACMHMLIGMCVTSSHHGKERNAFEGIMTDMRQEFEKGLVRSEKLRKALGE